MDPTVDEAKWRPLRDFQDYLPERYRLASDEQRQTGHGGGDFFIVEDFIQSILKGIPPPVDVYTACEWTAVGLLSELSITNQSRQIDMPHFRKNMPYNEQIIRL